MAPSVPEPVSGLSGRFQVAERPQPVGADMDGAADVKGGFPCYIPNAGMVGGGGAEDGGRMGVQIDFENAFDVEDRNGLPLHVNKGQCRMGSEAGGVKILGVEQHRNRPVDATGQAPMTPLYSASVMNPVKGL